MRSSGRLDRRAERQQDAERDRRAHADQREQHGERQAAPQAGVDAGEARHAAAHQREERGQRRRPQPREPATPACGDRGDDQRGGDDRGCRGGAPLLGVRVAAEQDQAPLLGDEAPAGAGVVQRAAGGVVSLPDRVAEEPAQHRRQREREQGEDRDAGRGVADAAEEVDARPREDSGRGVRRRSRRQRLERDRRGHSVRPRVAGRSVRAAARVRHRGHRSTMATRRLYQPITSAVTRLIARYTVMIMTTHSSAWPFWLIVVLAIETTSG